MKTTFDEFSRFTQSDWLAKVRADLKGASMDESMWHVDDEIIASPYTGPTPNPALSRVKRGPWQTGDKFFLIPGKEDEINAAILAALHGGVDALHLKINAHVDIARILDEVYVDMVHVSLDMTDAVDEASLRETLQAYFTSHPPASLSLWQSAGSGTSSVITINASDSITGALAEAFGDLLDGRKSAHVDLVVHIGAAYFVEIARLRAIHILHRNLKSAISSLPGITLEVHFDPDALTDDSHQNMIRSGSLTLSAIFGGAERIYTQVSKDLINTTVHDRRIARNVHHLVRYETDITQYSDAVTGSYYLEDLTRKIVEGTWQKLVTKLKSDGR